MNLLSHSLYGGINIEDHVHQHPLTLSMKRAKFCCDACGTEDKGLSYLCSPCQFRVHLECASLPDVIDLNDEHVHSLTLIASSHVGDNCRICDDELKADQWIYNCAKCSFGAHVGCSIPKRHNTNKSVHRVTDRQIQREEITQANTDIEMIMADQVKKDLETETETLVKSIALGLADNEVIGLTTTKTEKEILVKTTAFGLPNDEIIRNCATDECMPLVDNFNRSTTDYVEKKCREEETATELHHISHDQHSLTLVCDELRTGEQCNGCAQPISGPFYRCSESCNFILHKSCTQLSSEIHHPFHTEHPLKLFMKRPTSYWLLRCNMCSSLCNGFSYWCEQCEFGLDIKCSTIFGGLHHNAHDKHTLALFSSDSYTTKCRACGLDLKKWSMACFGCKFFLHIGCATLPLTAWYEFHRHPFALTYVFVEDESDEYYCDICEKEMNPKCWFYYCAKCNYLTHISCMVGRYLRTKLGIILGVEDHPHNGTVIEAKQSRSSFSIDFYCAECTMAIRSSPSQPLENI